jgi:hypothetical protein
MGFGGSANIFQAQIMDLMASLEFVQAYMDNLLIITRGILMSTFKKWRQCSPDCVTLDSKSMQLSHCSVHMKLNILVIYLPEMGLNPNQKSAGNTRAKPPNNFKKLRHFLGMVQYYQDMWARCSEMLAPLTDLVGECKETKTTRMNKTEENLGGGIQFINRRLTM